MLCEKLSIFGSTGFIGKSFINSNNLNFPTDKCLSIDRNSRKPKSKKILYLISTVDNYNVKKDLFIDIDTNLKILMEVLENCKNKDVEFNFISSWFVYGNTRLPAREIDNCDPTGFYSITKRCAEQLLISFCKTYNIKYRILRLCNTYGDGDLKASSKKNAMQYMINLLKQDEPVNLYEGGYVLRDLMHVSDVCSAIDLILAKGNLNEIYNVGSGNPTSMLEIINFAKNHLNSSSKIKSIKTPNFHQIVQPRDFYLDTSKLKNLGFKQKINIKQGIKKLCNQ
jgi:nucleoside-diphosphate-sugar epimerase